MTLFSVNWNTTNNFKTGITERETNELDLICKYKAGALYIETYVHDKYHNLEDRQEGSSDIFILQMASMNDSQNHKVRRVDIPNNKIKIAINTLFTPKRILQNHEQELFRYLIYNRVLKFISSERNADFPFA